ncbi:unnamed protein product, partial [Oncorhynchus mykiss]
GLIRLIFLLLLIFSPAGIKKRSKVPGVMITQFIEVLPEGKSTPDFLRKPIALTIQEGKLAIFKANVCGDPKPEVTWGRAKGDMSDTETFQKKYDEATGEYTLEIHRVSGEEADTYKCYAINEYGKAICTAALNVIEGENVCFFTLHITYLYDQLSPCILVLILNICY